MSYLYTEKIIDDLTQPIVDSKLTDVNNGPLEKEKVLTINEIKAQNIVPVSKNQGEMFPVTFNEGHENYGGFGGIKGQGEPGSGQKGFVPDTEPEIKDYGLGYEVEKRMTYLESKKYNYPVRKILTKDFEIDDCPDLGPRASDSNYGFVKKSLRGYKTKDVVDLSVPPVTPYFEDSKNQDSQINTADRAKAAATSKHGYRGIYPYDKFGYMDENVTGTQKLNSLSNGITTGPIIPFINQPYGKVNHKSGLNKGEQRAKYVPITTEIEPPDEWGNPGRQTGTGGLSSVLQFNSSYPNVRGNLPFVNER